MWRFGSAAGEWVRRCWAGLTGPWLVPVVAVALVALGHLLQVWLLRLEALLGTVDRQVASNCDWLASEEWQLVRPSVETMVGQLELVKRLTAPVTLLLLVLAATSPRLPMAVRMLVPLAFIVYMLGGFYPLPP